MPCDIKKIVRRIAVEVLQACSKIPFLNGLHVARHGSDTNTRPELAYLQPKHLIMAPIDYEEDIDEEEEDEEEEEEEEAPRSRKRTKKWKVR